MTWARRVLARDGERGSASIEAVIAAPAIGLFVGLVILGGRLALAGQTVESAAYEAARSASIARTAALAASSSHAAATATLANQSLTCASTNVSVDVSGFSAPTGTPASVEATVTCVVALGDLTLPGVPGTRTVTATAVSPIDTYRERS